MKAGAAGGASAQPKPKPVRKQLSWAAWCWRQVKPRGIIWPVSVVVVALLFTGNAGILREAAVTLGLLNTAVASTAGALVSAAGSMVNVSVDAGQVVRDMASTTANFARTFYHGVDLANITVHRRHGRLVAASTDEILAWLHNFNASSMSTPARAAFLENVINVSEGVPFIEASDFWLDAARGDFVHWQYKVRRGRDGFVGFAFVVTAASFVPKWAFPGWEVLEVPLEAAAKDIATTLFSVLRELEPLPASVLALDDPVVPLPLESRAQSRRYGLWAILAFMTSIAIVRLGQLVFSWIFKPQLHEVPFYASDAIWPDQEVSPSSSYDGFQLVDSTFSPTV